MTDKKFSYVLVGNIPSKFHSVDLRSFFSQFIETEKFDCFHFRHRPEVLKRKIDIENGDNSELTNDFIKGKTTCCVVRLKKENVKGLLEIYDGENWTDKDGKLCAQKAVISRIIIKSGGLSNGMYKTRKEQRDHTREKIEFVMDDLLKLSELHPPSFMPNGNIGTSLTTFMSLIRTCRLPPHVIKKLGLSFPSSRSKHCYGNVRLDYGNDANEGGISLCPEDGVKKNAKDESVESEETSVERTSIQHNLLGPFLMDSNHSNQQNIVPNNAQNSEMQNTDKSSLNKSSPNIEVGNRPNKKFESSKIASDHEQNSNAEDCESSSDTESEPEEDWERHEALHDDVDCQGRTKERLFENKIELKWEKGGSGLVFYTDAAYWDSLSGDFDEQTVDDWDIDMSIYEKGGYGDRHSKALMDMRIAEQRRLDIDDTSKIGDFEKHTKGFGSKVMKSQGWTEGSSLGSSQVGITEPVPNEGQLPYCKTGLGYYGEKLDRHIKRPRVDKEVIISTVFDETANEKVSTPRQSAGPFTLKYRRKMPDFVRQGDKKV